ncbi:hypothetical protein [Candidatus Midichloria mitochondrii]|uniref:Uncharacterized protein n=1 Tax=Midichloria mitochondrii (strain IricVA) TaxID=696127 RepID=F7XU27_MIDMI|nr:hypothetical protein [Candidatus Midichloria mitochondrii]AEI89386.1 hypothetical protein midi_01109 [Candidatus Midichloria mitochondrii IricVA]
MQNIAYKITGGEKVSGKVTCMGAKKFCNQSHDSLFAIKRNIYLE